MSKDQALKQAQPPLPGQEPWGACVSGRVFVGALPEHVRKLAEDDGLPIQLLYTAPPQRKPLTHIQAKAEPVGEVTHVSDNGFKCEFSHLLAIGTKLYIAPPLPVQEDAFEGWVKIDELREHFNAVNCGTIYRHGGEGRVPLYTAPPQREWVGLTEQDMPSGEDPMFDHQYFIAGMVYAAKVLQEKNND